MVKKKKPPCIVCGGDLGRKNKICVECAPFWRKAGKIIDAGKIEDKKDNTQKKKPLRKPVIFDTKNEENNKILFAQEMLKEWDKTKDEQTGKHICPYIKTEIFKKTPTGVDPETKKALELLVFSPDRIKSAAPYKKGNIKICSYFGNIMKNTLNETDFNSVIFGIIEYHLTQDGGSKEIKNMVIELLGLSADKQLNDEEIKELFRQKDKKE